MNLLIKNDIEDNVFSTTITIDSYGDATYTSDEEKDLISHLASLTGVIVNAANTYDPAKITHYATDLATKFHRFYNAQRVMVDDESLMQARIFLCICVRNTMKNVLSMLKIDAPVSM